MMIKGWIKTRFALAICGLVGALIVTIVASFLPSLVEHTIQNRVKDSVRLDPTTLSASSLQLFLNATTNVDYHLYNATNLFQALTIPNTPLQLSDITIRTTRYVQKYSVTWDHAADQVNYNEIATLVVNPDDQWLLAQPIIGINPFYVGAAAQVMRQVMQQQAQSATPSADFTLLNEQLLTAGLVGAQVVPAIVRMFGDPTQPFLVRLRMFLLPLYLEAAREASMNMGNWPADRDAWALGQESLSVRNASAFVGFELPRSLACGNPRAAAASLFDGNNGFSLVMTSGVTRWLSVVADTSTSVEVMQLATVHQITLEDVSLVAEWIANVTQQGAYEVTTCASLSRALTQVASNSSALQAAMSSDGASAFLSLATWAQVGALQWATGWVLALQVSSTALAATGLGVSASQVSVFADVVTALEFQFGVNYYLTTNPSASFCAVGCPIGSNQVLLWQTNPQLLLSATQVPPLNNDAWPVILSQVTATQLLNTLVSSSTTYGALCQILGGFTNIYATTLASSLGTGSNLSTSITLATTAITSAFSTLDALTLGLLTAAHIDTTNW